MPTNTERVPLIGSERTAIPGARPVGAVPAGTRFEVTVILRPKQPLTGSAAERAAEDLPPAQRRYLTRGELAERYGANPDDAVRVRAFARGYGLKVKKVDLGRRSLVLAGRAAAFCAAFGTVLQLYDYPDGSFRGRTGELTIPADLQGVIVGVFGLDDRPQGQAHFQVSSRGPAAANGSFTPVELAQLYRFPTGLDGSGECIAIVELGGGYRTADLKTYFKRLGLPAPKVKAVLVDGAHNQPTNANSADGEVMLDIEVAASIAPRASIVVYFAPNSDRGFLDAINQAVQDKTNRPSVVSISWGGAEPGWTAQALTQFDQAFQAAAALGVTVCAAAGDNGSSDGVADGHPHVDFPASSPNVLGCGGTRLVASGTQISSETVWNEGPNSATGGGVSGTFPQPVYQKGIPIPAGAASGRGVPDVAGDADPATGYQVRVDGQDLVIGGTSAVAPLWAGLIALFNQKLGKPVGFLNPSIYASQAGKTIFNDVTSGNNGAFAAGAGWDACTGWGSPIGASLLATLGG